MYVVVNLGGLQLASRYDNSWRNRKVKVLVVRIGCSRNKYVKTLDDGNSFQLTETLCTFSKTVVVEKSVESRRLNSITAMNS